MLPPNDDLLTAEDILVIEEHNELSPPDHIPFGLSSKITAVVGSLFALITSIDFVIDGNLTQDAVVSMILSAISFFVLAGGRYAQAAMKALGDHLS